MGTEDHPAVQPNEAIDRLENDAGLDQSVVAALREAAARHGFNDDGSEANWLARARFATREPAAHVDGIRVSMATIAAELAQEDRAPDWILRHDHPDHRMPS